MRPRIQAKRVDRLQPDGKQGARDGKQGGESLPDAIRNAVRLAQRELGGKALGDYFPGPTGRPASKATISRWISEPYRFPAVHLPALASFDPRVFPAVVHALATPSLSPDFEANAQVRRAGERGGEAF